MADSAENPIFSLLRAEDMLALTFELVNLVLDTTQTPPQLIRTMSGPAFIIVHFPAQHIAEQVFDEDATGQPSNLVSPPVQSTLADPTRLAFQVPDAIQSIPFNLQSLLDWAQFDLQVAPNALPDGTTSGPGLRAPSPQETAIEVPYRLILSPDQSAGWKHAIPPVTRDDRTELWHTRLGVLNSSGSGVDESHLPTVRAIWARDMDPSIPVDISGSALTGALRSGIASASSDFTTGTPPAALENCRLMLSALGASTDLALLLIVPDVPVANFQEWTQLISVGRDQIVRIVTQVFLCPFRHRALLVQDVQRKLEQQTEYLVRHTSLVQLDVTENYTTSDIIAAYLSRGREMPFKQVTLKIQDNLALDTPPERLTFPIVGGQNFRFSFSAMDQDDQLVHFTLPLVVVPAADITFGVISAGDIKSAYDADLSSRTADLGNQLVGFATPPQFGGARLKSANIVFTIQEAAGLMPPFLPEMDVAKVSHPAVDHLLGSSAGTPGATQITFHDTYLRGGFDPGINSIQVFATLLNPPSLGIPADKAGGLVTPKMNIDGLTCVLGPVANTSALLSGDLQQFRNSIDGNLLGGITLKQVIDAVTGAPIETIESQVPKLLTTQSADAIETSFEWHPRIAAMGNPLPPPPSPPLVTVQDPNDPTKSTNLDIHVVNCVPIGAGDPTFTVDGILSNFALNFFNIVLVTFDQLHFHAEPGKKVDVNPRGVNVEFIGELSLLNRLAELLPPGGFSDPPVLDVTPDGITAGYTLGVPAAGIGAFSLENIAISAQLSLPFANPVKLRLAFSERFHPFLVTVSLVGGGGFLAIDADAQGGIAVEGSLELGANITISLAIIEANAHVLMGFYFRINSTNSGSADSEFTFYIRIGASVDLLGLVSVSVDLYLGLTFTPKCLMTNPPPGILGVVGGVAALVIGVHLLFIDKSFTLSFERHFDIPARASLPLVGSVSLPILSDPSFDEMVCEPDWETYCQAFA